MATEAQKPRISFIDLGEMGSRIAMRLLKADYPLTVYNRTEEGIQPFTQQGAIPLCGQRFAITAQTPKELASQCQVVISCVTNDAAIKSVLLDAVSGALAGAKPDTLFIDMSTIAPATSRRLAEAAELHTQINSPDVFLNSSARLAELAVSE